MRGLNAGITFSGAHDSSIGWYSVVTPALSYTFTPHYSADISLSIYPYRPVPSRSAKPPYAWRLSADKGDTSDTLIGFHASFDPAALRNTTTASFTLPTGDSSIGLGTGKVTFDFSEHLERDAGSAVFLVDLGVGDSSTLFNSLVIKDYSSVGPLAHFQAGAAFWLFGRDYLQSIAYEQLPFGGQTVYTASPSPGAPATTLVLSNSASEDNGFTTSLSIPVSEHVTLSGYYNRSMRHDLDTASFGVTYVLRGTTWKKRLSLIDRALREAEGANP